MVLQQERAIGGYICCTVASHTSQVAATTLLTHTPSLLHVVQGDTIIVLEEEMAGPSKEDGVARWALHLLGHIIPKILDHKLTTQMIGLYVHVHFGWLNPPSALTWWVLSKTANLFLASHTAVRPEDRLPSTSVLHTQYSHNTDYITGIPPVQVNPTVRKQFLDYSLNYQMNPVKPLKRFRHTLLALLLDWKNYKARLKC
jgi:hypothetical protein